MKYLFFDVECANCFNGVGKICEFGYVLTDENFKTLMSDDIPMSPGNGKENRFYLKGRKGEKDLELAYDESFYKEQPEFPAFYKQIKKIMEDQNTICFAFSMENDIHHLASTCARYKLNQINFTCYDVQKLAAKYLELNRQIGLENACKRIVGPHALVKLQAHLSRDDSFMEMMILEALCELNNTKSDSLLKECEYAKTNSIEFMNRAKEKKTKKRVKTKGHELYSSLSIPHEDIDNPDYIGKRYNFSGELKSHFEELNLAISKVKENGGVLCNNLSKTDFFIVFDETNKKDILDGFKRPFEGRVLTFKEFMDI